MQIKNIGATNGTEIVQLYVSPKDGAIGLKPIQLKGFKRVALKRGEETAVTFKVSPDQLAQFENNQWIVKSGAYIFKLGASSSDIRLSKSIVISGNDRVLKNGRSIFFSLNN